MIDDICYMIYDYDDYITLYYIILCYIILHYIILYYAILYYIILRANISSYNTRNSQDLHIPKHRTEH